MSRNACEKQGNWVREKKVRVKVLLQRVEDVERMDETKTTTVHVVPVFIIV